MSGKLIAIVNNEKYFIKSNISEIENNLENDETAIVIPIGPLMTLNSYGHRIIIDNQTIDTMMIDKNK